MRFPLPVASGRATLEFPATTVARCYTVWTQPVMKHLAAVGMFLASVAIAAPFNLPRSTPESQGVSSVGLLNFIESADQIDAMNSFMLVRHGHVVAEGWWAPYNPESRHELYSLSKSFTSTAVGIAASEGKLSIDDEVLKFFSADGPAQPSANLKLMRVSDLLRMSTGHQDEPSSAATTVSPKTFLAQPVPHKPGTHFKYNTAATFMLSAIVQQQTGMSVLDYLQPRLFGPLGIAQPTWDTNFQGVSLGGYGLKVRTEDIAKFGQLYLQKGQWHGQQLVPAGWVESATARQTSNGSNPASDWDQGYGYQFWRCRHGAFRGDGAFGQYCVVLPDQDAVIAITSGVKDMQATLNLIWDKILPALQPHRLASDKVNQQKLTARLSGLTVRYPEGAATSPVGTKVFGKKFIFSANDQKLETLEISPTTDGGWVLTTRSNGVETRLACGNRSWKIGRGPFGNRPEEALGASAAWRSEDTFSAKVCAFETPFYQTITLRFEGNNVVREVQQNTGFGATKQPPLTGHVE